MEWRRQKSKQSLAIRVFTLGWGGEVGGPMKTIMQQSAIETNLVNKWRKISGTNCLSSCTNFTAVCILIICAIFGWKLEYRDEWEGTSLLLCSSSATWASGKNYNFPFFLQPPSDKSINLWHNKGGLENPITLMFTSADKLTDPCAAMHCCVDHI